MIFYCLHRNGNVENLAQLSIFLLLLLLKNLVEIGYRAVPIYKSYVLIQYGTGRYQFTSIHLQRIASYISVADPDPGSGIRDG
jgi:hypothetical protein